MKFFKAVFSVLSKVSASRFLLAALALLMTIGQLSAQGWVKRLGGTGLDQAEDIKTTIDGGYLLLGFRQTTEGERVYLVRTDIDGEELWSDNYGDGNVHGYQMVENEDGSILVVGDRRASAQSTDNVYLLKVDRTGTLLWERELLKEGNQTGQSIIAVSDGGYLIAGQTDATDSGEDDVLLIRIDNNGNETWSKTFGQDKDDRAFGLAEVSDGYVLTGISERPDADAADNDIILIKVDKTGAFVWDKRISTEEAEEAYDIVATDEDAIVIAGYQGNSNDILIAKYNAEGEEIWTTTFDNRGLGDQASFIRKLDDGNFLLTGLTEVTEANIDLFVAGVDADGNFTSIQTLGSSESIDQGVALDLTLDGGLIVSSTSSPLTALVDDILLFKTDGSLNTLTNKIEGEVVYLNGGDCATVNAEVEFSHPRWIVVAEQGDKRFFGTTDENGRFEIDVDSGDYQLSAIRTSELWSLCEERMVSFDRQFDTTIQVVLTTQFNAVIDQQEGLADLRVDMAAPYVLEGGEVVYDVIVFNEGTEGSEEVTVEIQLDEELDYVSSKGNGPNDTLSNIENGFLVYRINPSEINRGDFSRFKIIARARSIGDNMVIRQAISSTGVSRSNNNFIGGPESDLQVNVYPPSANEELAKISIKNIGRTIITQPINGVVIQDDIGFLRGDYTPSEEGLINNPADSITINDFNFEGGFTFDEIAPSGKTLRFIATIEGQGLEGAGTQALEPYGRDENDGYNAGFFRMYPEDDEYRDTVIDVRETRASLEAIEMTGYPNGYRDSIVAANTDLSYTIYFENTGTDTIERVVIRDTLPDLLDLTTVIPGASNWPYRFEVDGNGIVKFTFDEVKIYPAGSGADIDSTYGYVKFVVSQKPNLPAGSVIQNRAAVFFDYKAPNPTNFVRRLVGQYPDFIEFSPLTNTDEPVIPGVDVKIYPNPFIDGAVFEIKGKEFRAITLRVFDLEGKLIESYQHSGNKFMYYRNRKLPSGTYIYRLESEGQLINSGKLLVR